jgi:TnpA family transposase
MGVRPVPVEFLSAEQCRRYGRFAGEPTAAQLGRFFHLDGTDLALIATRRQDHNRLGMAVQLGTVRFLGTFLENPSEVPAGVVGHVVEQLVVAGLLGQVGESFEGLKLYRDGEARWDHQAQIRARYGFREFSDGGVQLGLIRWLYARCWVMAERPSVLFDLATARLVDARVLLPGASVLARLVARARERVAARLWSKLAGLVDDEHRQRLERLLVVPDGARTSPLEQLRRPPTAVNARAMVAALARIEELGGYEVVGLDLSGLPQGRVSALARYATVARSGDLAQLSSDRRVATLLAFAQAAKTRAVDEALDIFCQLLGELSSRVERRGQTERLRALADLDAAALRLREAVAVVLDPGVADEQVRALVFDRVAPEALAAAVADCDRLARLPDDHFEAELLSRYSMVRQFLPSLFRTIEFQAGPGGQPVLEALEALRAIEGRRKIGTDDVPTRGIRPRWQRLISSDGEQLNRRAYTFAVLEALRGALRAGDVFVPGSGRWGDPRAKLLTGSAWHSARPQLCRALGLSERPSVALAALGAQLEEAYQRSAERLGANTAVQLADGRVKISALDRLEEPESLRSLRQRVGAVLPRVDLPDVLAEVAAWTGFTEEFTHAADVNPRVDDLGLSICAVLLSEACNVGLEPIVHPNVAALTRGRLSWVAQNYLRAETLVRANARLVDYHATLPLAQAWGGGEVASADGLRFVVPVRSINAGPNPRYFGVGRGVTYFNYTSDQFTGFHAIVIPGTLRDSLYILDGLLQHETSLRPTEVMTDSASYSDQVFGLFRMLGYQFSPRLADIGDTRFWRFDRQASYGPFDQVARHRINTELITAHWDDLLRVAGSLLTGSVRASELLRVLQGGGRPTSLGRAVAEIGRIAKTIFLLAYLDDESYRRRILVQLNRGEARHALARNVFHGQRGELRQPYREGQEDQLNALGLVVNAIALWNTRYMAAALQHLQAVDGQTRLEDVQRLSPLRHDHINLHGRYYFTPSDAITRGELRNLRDPANPNLAP